MDLIFAAQSHEFLCWKLKYLWNLYKKTQTPFKWHEEAFILSKKINVPIFSTPFSTRAVDMLEKLKTPLYKIASFEITDLKLIERIAKTRKPVIVSTGMARLDEINRAVNLIKKYHNKIRLTLDYIEDYCLIHQIYQSLYKKNKFFNIKDVLRFLDKKKELSKINKKYIKVNWYRHHLKKLKTIKNSATSTNL